MESIGEKGIVVETKGQIAVVRINRSNACAHCKAGCMERGGYMMTEAENSAGAEVGDTVRLKFDQKAALTAALIVFGLPLLALLFGTIVTSILANQMGYGDHSQALSISVGGILFLLAFVPIKLYDRRIKKRESHSVNVLEVLEKKTLCSNEET